MKESHFRHEHFDSIGSTQTYLKKAVQGPWGPWLVTCFKQTRGYGRKGRPWAQLPHTLCFSFTLQARGKLTLIPLEVGVFLAQYLEEASQEKVFLKWPNDLFLEQKCGGILVDIQRSWAIVGVGVNMGDFEGLPFEQRLHKEFPSNFYRALLGHRIKEDEVPALWESRCMHLNRPVFFEDRPGIFRGINDQGGALIEFDGQVSPFFSGTLRMAHLVGPGRAL